MDFLSIGLVLQIIAIVISAVLQNDPYLVITAISGITGIIAVVLCSRGKLSQYIFGYVQLFTYLFGVAIPLALWGEVIENIFYALTMIIGIIVWIKRYRNTGDEIVVKTKEMTGVSWIITVLSLGILIPAVAFLLPKLSILFPSIFIETDPWPLLDSITTVVPLYGQILMCFGYADQWIFWLVEDMMSLIMFILAQNWIMVAQYIFWTANCVYGYVTWKKLAKN